MTMIARRKGSTRHYPCTISMGNRACSPSYPTPKRCSKAATYTRAIFAPPQSVTLSARALCIFIIRGLHNTGQGLRNHSWQSVSTLAHSRNKSRATTIRK